MKKQIDLATQTKLSWLDTLIDKVKTIEKQWVQDTFKKYRECGQLIIEAGHESGQWNSEAKEYFLAKTGYGERTFRRMVELGKLSDDEFRTRVSDFKSIHQWSNQKALTAPKDMSLDDMTGMGVSCDVPPNKIMVFQCPCCGAKFTSDKLKVVEDE